MLTQAQASNLPPCTPPRANIAVPNSGAVWDGFCWGITPWDTKKVENALKVTGDHRFAETFVRLFPLPDKVEA